MALSKKMTQDNGVTTAYHRISKMECDYDAQRSTVMLASYVSEDIRAAGTDRCAKFRVITLAGVGDRAWAYDQIKKSEAEFSDAADA